MPDIDIVSMLPLLIVAAPQDLEELVVGTLLEPLTQRLRVAQNGRFRRGGLR